MTWIKERFPLLIVCAALVLVFLGLVFLNGQYGQNTYEAYTKSNTTEQSQMGPNARLPVPNFQKPATSDKHTNEPDWQTADHKAQIQMMRAAWTAVTLTFVGLCLLAITTGYARLAWLAAKEAVIVTREIGEKQSCAYIKMENIRVGHNQGYAICEITIENVGNSPCVEGEISARVKSENTLIPTFMETNETRDFYSAKVTRNFGIIQTGRTHTVSFMWFGGHYKEHDTWFDLFLSDIGTDSRVLFDVRWKDVFGKWHASSFDAHKYHGKGINWDDLSIWHEDLKINPQQTYKRDT